MQLGSRRRETEGQLLGSLSGGAMLICQAPLQLLSMLKSEMGTTSAQVPLTLNPVFCLPVPSLEEQRCKKGATCVVRKETSSVSAGGTVFDHRIL